MKRIGILVNTVYVGPHFEVANGVEASYIFAGSQRVAKVTGAGTQYFHQDHLDSATRVTNETGALVEQAEYLPFGEMRAGSSSPPFASNYKYTDQEMDVGTGLYNYDARLYDPIIGRFISPDPIVPDPTNPQALNRYSYALNNPLRYVDPTGNESVAPNIGELPDELSAPTPGTDCFGTPFFGGDAGPKHGFTEDCLPPHNGPHPFHVIQAILSKAAGNAFFGYMFELGTRNGETYGAKVFFGSKVGGEIKLFECNGSTFPNPLGSPGAGGKAPGITQGAYNSVYFTLGHKGEAPGIKLYGGGPVPTMGPNPEKGGAPYADGVNLHEGFSNTSRGSANCLTIEFGYGNAFFHLFVNGEKGTVVVFRP